LLGTERGGRQRTTLLVPNLSFRMGHKKIGNYCIGVMETRM
jgi:hypothetical protein